MFGSGISEPPAGATRQQPCGGPAPAYAYEIPRLLHNSDSGNFVRGYTYRRTRSSSFHLKLHPQAAVGPVLDCSCSQPPITLTLRCVPRQGLSGFSKTYLTELQAAQAAVTAWRSLGLRADDVPAEFLAAGAPAQMAGRGAEVHK